MNKISMFSFGSRSARSVTAIVFCLVLAACGGGDSGSSAASITVTPTNLNFTPPGTSPKTQSLQLTVNFSGDFVLGGYAPGVPQPPWIGAISTGPITGSAGARSVSFAVPVIADGLPAGTVTTSLRMVTGRGNPSTNPSDISFVDVPVTMVVQ
jgi:hypothetical protein